jgi:hypothetical protein
VFDEIFGMAVQSIDSFRFGVRDSFGSAMIADVLDPILKEINSLHIFNEEFQNQLVIIDRVLEEARSIHSKECGDLP